MTDHAKELERLLKINWNDKVSQAISQAAEELRRLQSENASLWALAKFGREMLSARNLSPIPLSDSQMDGLRAVINDLAELCDLLKIDPNSETLVETPLAQLPGERE